MRIKTVIAVCLLAMWAIPAAAQDTQTQPGTAPAAQAQPSTGQAAAATSSAPLPTADQIIEKYQQASGGKEAWDKLTSVVMKGSFEMEQMEGEATQEIYGKAPNKVLFVTDSPSFGTVKRAFNGTAGWQDNPQTGLADITGGELAALKREADFYGVLDLKTLYPKMTVKGKESVDGHDAYVVEATPAEGAPVTMSFDAASGLLVRSETVADTAMGQTNVQTTLSDYREVDGVQVPFQIHSDMGGFAFTIKLNDVKHNVDIDDAKFDKPAPPPATQQP